MQGEERPLRPFRHGTFGRMFHGSRGRTIGNTARARQGGMEKGSCRGLRIFSHYAKFLAHNERQRSRQETHMAQSPLSDLSRREREVLEVVYRRERATASEVMDEMVDPPSYSSVRSVLTKLENKGHIRHEADGPRHVYFPVVRRERASRQALRHLLTTFFDGSPEQVVNALLDVSKSKLSADELARIDKMIKQARKEGR